MSKHQRGRQQAVVQQRLRPVDICDYGIEQLRALRHRALDHRPLVFIDKKRQQVQRPRTRFALVRVDVVADVVIADLLRNGGGRPVEVGYTVVAEEIEELLPGSAQLARRVAQFVPMTLRAGTARRCDDTLARFVIASNGSVDWKAKLSSFSC